MPPMRPIKFRGRRIDNGEYVYGDLLTGGNEFAIINDTLRAMVDPDTVAQLVGYDKDGKEVYEGDAVIEEYVEGESKEHVARLESMTQVPETALFYFFPFPAPFTTLKEINHD